MGSAAEYGHTPLKRCTRLLILELHDRDAAKENLVASDN